MVKLHAIIFPLMLSVFFPTIVFCRFPLFIEQTQCRIVFADKLSLNNGIRWIEAYDNSNGTLCETFCRIRSLESTIPLSPIASPDFILCAIGPRYCYKGICDTALAISRIIGDNKNSEIISPIDDSDDKINDSVNDEVTWDISTNTNISSVNHQENIPTAKRTIK